MKSNNWVFNMNHIFDLKLVGHEIKFWVFIFGLGVSVNVLKLDFQTRRLHAFFNMNILVFFERTWWIKYIELSRILMIRSGFDHLHLRLLSRRLLAADRLYLVYSLVMVVKPLMVAERGIAPLDFALVGGLACVNILMVFKIDFLRKKPLQVGHMYFLSFLWH